MKWYGPPWLYNNSDNKTDTMQLILQFEEWREKQEKKRKKADKLAADEKKKKEAEQFKLPQFSVPQMCILLVALGPPVGMTWVIMMFYLVHKLSEAIGIK